MAPVATRSAAQARRHPVTAWLGAAIVLLALYSAQPWAAGEALQSMSGQPAQIDDYTGQGKWTVVMIWSVDCGICYEEMPNYGKLHSARKDKDLQVLGVALDGFQSTAVVQAFLDDRDGVFPNLLADLGPFARQYADEVGESLMGTPTFLVFDPKGELVGNQPGPMRVAALESFIARKSAQGK